ncbi:hypothetical protein G6F56_007682 [Rhizopus delemar]|nr:hypothetical protein G6F56_007682 [Rhizopus delemar]
MMTRDSSSDTSRCRNNTFSWSSTQSSIFTQSTVLSIYPEEDSIWTYLMLHGYSNLNTDQERQEKITEMICRLASHGNLIKIQQLMVHERTRGFVQLDAVDNEDWSPLMYASCFGKSSVARYLLDLGVKINAQDKLGWTCLMWAVTNDHCDMVEMLLEYNASFDIISLNGTSAYDLVNPANDRMMHILSLYRPLPTKAQFIWNRCLPDQMFVFSDNQIDTILNTTISQFKLPIKSRSEVHVPANIIFLSARYAHYYTTKEAMDHFLNQALQRTQDVIQAHTQDVHTLAFWISNLSQLLCYLKKDSQLLIKSGKHQIHITELISEAYTCLVQDSQRRLDHILEPAMLDFEPLEGIDIQFAHDWQRFFRRSSVSLELSPSSVTHLLTSILYVLQSYKVHQTITTQVLSQLFYFFSCELFNRILINKRFLCRSRALQIRMNLSVIEEWIRQQALPFESFLTPVVQMIQLLQCVSQLVDLMDFINTINTFDLLNSVQIKRLILQYRYEVNECRLPDEIEKYTMQIAEDTLKQYSTPRPKSSLGLFYKKNQSQEVGLAETKDSTYLLPFSLPSLDSSTGGKLECTTPVIPEDWLIRLDQVY